MAGFGGAVKLKGESEYKRALSQITQNLREVSSEMKAVSSSFDKNDHSTAALNAKTQVLNKTLDAQKQKLSILQAQYSDFSAKMTQQTASHEKLVSTYNQEKAKLDELAKTVDTSSKEYKEAEQKHKELTNSYNQEKAKLDELAKTVGKSSTEYQEQKEKVNNLGKELKENTTEYQAQKEKVEQLSRAVSESARNQDANAKSMAQMRVQMNNAQADINKTTKELDALGNEAEDSGKKAENAGGGGFTVFKGALADLVSAGIQRAIDGLKALASKLVDVGKQAYTQYSSYEQLVGGVDTLFKDSSQKVQKYASNAYKTAGISANQYMEQVTSFSATLLQGLNGDTAKAADIANVAITDMADNANKMGTSMTDIQNAYQGFAKDNYTIELMSA